MIDQKKYIHFPAQIFKKKKKRKKRAGIVVKNEKRSETVRKAKRLLLN